MTFYQQRGRIPAKHFTVLPREEGGRYYEELYNSEGFDGPASLLYHIHQPTRVLGVDPAGSMPVEPWQQDVVRNHIIDPVLLKSGGDPFDARVPITFNKDLVYSVATPDTGGHRFLRNGGKDELHFVVEGSGTFKTTMGDIDYEPMDFVYIPRGTTWKLEPELEGQCMIVMEASSPIAPPSWYRNNKGQFLSKAIYSERDIRVPDLPDPTDETGEFEVAVKVGEILSTYRYEHHPFDVVGWDGALYPYALNMRDVEPLSGRVNLDPNMDAVFACEGVLIAAITPARLPDHPNAIPNIPDHNTDCDEIFYRLASDDESMHGMGKLTVHTRAGGHGAKPGHEWPEPGLRRELWGVILDCVAPLDLTEDAMPADDPDYPRAWL